MCKEDGKNKYVTVDGAWVREHLPPRPKTANKGSFGKTLLIVGSDKYRGAAHLSLSMALRGGAGYVSYLGEPSLAGELRAIYPEAIYYSTSDTEELLAISDTQSSVLVGSGSGVSRELYSLICRLIARDGGPVIIDADGLNSLARFAPSVKELFSTARRKVILTPHPLELSRLSGLSVEEIQSEREGVARRLALEWGVVLLLKGSGTVVTDGERTLINSSGSSALAKAGSGDVLSGLIASISAYTADALFAAGISAYLHGAAGDRLAAELTEYGVTPSDLPLSVCGILSEILNG